MHGFLFHFLLPDNAHIIITILLGTKFQYLHTGRQIKRGNNPRRLPLDLVLTSFPKTLSIPQRKLFLLMLVLILIV